MPPTRPSRAALERHLPLVTVGNPRLPKVPLVGADNRRAAAEVARHLLDLGHRRFAVRRLSASSAARPARCSSSGSTASGSPARRRDPCGGIEVIARPTTAGPRARAAVRDCRAGRVPGRPDRGVRRHRHPRARRARLCGRCCGARARRPVGRRVRRHRGRRTSTPPLTTVEHDLFGQGRAAARLALRLIAGESVRAPRIGAELIERASTGPVPLYLADGPNPPATWWPPRMVDRRQTTWITSPHLLHVFVAEREKPS